MALGKPIREGRGAYRYFHDITTRWMDNDAYGHANNVVYYSWFDTAVNAYLLKHEVLDMASGATIGLVVETGCNYFASVSFPDRVNVGVRVARLGQSSVRYEIGVFANDDEVAAAQGHFVHVYVDRATRRPMPLPAGLRAVLESISSK